MIKKPSEWVTESLAAELFNAPAKEDIKEIELQSIVQFAQKHAVDILIYY